MPLTKATFSMVKGAAVNVLDYGATGDGVTDDTASIQAAVNAGRRVYFPQPSGAFYKCTAPITLASDTVIEGANKQNTTVKFFGCSGFISDPSAISIFDIQIRNICLIGDSAGIDCDGIRIGHSGVNPARLDIENVVIGYFKRNGVSLIKPIVSQLRLVSSSFNGANGFYIEGDATSVYASSCYANGNSVDGWQVKNNVSYSAFDGCASDKSGRYGWNFEGTPTLPAQGICLSGCGAEASGSDQYRFVATLGLTLNSIYTFPNFPSTGGNYITLDGARHVSLNGIRMEGAAPAGKYALYLDNIATTQYPTDISLNGCIFASTNAQPNEVMDVNVQPRFKHGSGTYSNGDVITHNLGITPSDVLITSGSGIILGAASGLTSTTFTLSLYNVSASPATPVSNQAIRWIAYWQA